MSHLILSNSFEYDADERQPWEANGSDRLKFRFYFWFTEGKCLESRKGWKTQISALIEV
jgi:hypothetical protein